MRSLVIGLGSMGKRRVRNLMALGYKNIAGYDPRQERTEFVKKEYEIETYTDFDNSIEKFQPEVLIISTPPDLHMKYAYYALKNNLHCFVEASVTDGDKIINLSKELQQTDLVIVPSCTMRFYPGPMKIKELVNDGIVGKPLNFNYQSGQYLPDWHPWENIEDFYVSNTETGGCREIVPFELTWLNDIFGDPSPIACTKRKLTDMNVPIDDIYHCLLDYPNGMIGNMTVEVISRPKATREFRLIGSQGEILFSDDDKTVKFINTSMKKWKILALDEGSVEKQYINPEEPYIEEMRQFSNAVAKRDISLFPNSMYDDYKVLKNLYDLEKLSNRN